MGRSTPTMLDFGTRLASSKEIANPSLFGIPVRDSIRPYEIEEAVDGSVTFMRFHPGDGDGNSLILRYTITDVYADESGESGDPIATLTRVERAVGPWDNRRIADGLPGALYWYPVNGTAST